MDLLPVVAFIDTESEIELCLLRRGEQFTIGWALLDVDTLETAEIGVEAQRMPWRKLLELLMQAYAKSLEFRKILVRALPESLQLPNWLPSSANSVNQLHTQAQMQLAKQIQASTSERAFIAAVECKTEPTRLGVTAEVKADVEEWTLSGIDGTLPLFSGEELLRLYLCLLVDEQATEYFSPLCQSRGVDHLGDLIQGVLEVWARKGDTASYSASTADKVESAPDVSPTSDKKEVVVAVQDESVSAATMKPDPQLLVVVTTEPEVIDPVFELPPEDLAEFIADCATPTGEDPMVHFDLIVLEIIEGFSDSVHARAA
jgi:hypothetical protein